MFIILNDGLSPVEETFLGSTLIESDDVMVSEKACHLAMQPKKWSARCYIRESDVKRLGQQCHPDWAVITDREWLNLTMNQDKTISW